MPRFVHESRELPPWRREYELRAPIRAGLMQAAGRTRSVPVASGRRRGDGGLASLLLCGTARPGYVTLATRHGDSSGFGVFAEIAYHGDASRDTIPMADSEEYPLVVHKHARSWLGERRRILQPLA